jgi:hypothetical protein
MIFNDIILRNVNTLADDGCYMGVTRVMSCVCDIRPHLNHVIQRSLFIEHLTA